MPDYMTKWETEYQIKIYTQLLVTEKVETTKFYFQLQVNKLKIHLKGLI